MGYELVIVGGGNMGAALLGGLLASGRYPAEGIAVVEIVADRRRQLEAQFPGVTTSESMPECRAAVLAVKPPDAPAAATTAAAAGATRLLSIAAGVRVAALQEAAGPAVAVVRAMPNTPALVGKGASVIAAGASAGDDDLAWAEAVLGAVGTVDRLPEEHLDAITALTGSGPAYLFLVAEALVDAAEQVGLPRSLADDPHDAVVRGFLGAARRAGRRRRVAGDGDVARRNDRRRSARARGARRARGVRRGRRGGGGPER